MRLIDADRARAEATIDLVVHYLDRQPTIDAVPVVRCRDCKHRRFAGVAPFMYHCCGHNDGLVGKVNEDDFCSYGERKDGGIND